jgi:uncharacterized membrane protein YqiK
VGLTFLKGGIEMNHQKMTRGVWYSWLIALIIGLLSLLFAPKAGLFFLGIVFLFLGISLKEIKQPKTAFLFDRGRMVGELSPGWYLCLPWIWEFLEISKGTQEILLEKEEMYTAEKTAIILRGGIYYKVVDLQKAVNISEETAKSRIKRVVLAKLKGAVGQKKFEELLHEKGTLEEAIKDDCKTELEPDGYEVTGVEIEDIEEKIHSEAEKIRAIGTAEAEVSRKKAEAIAGPLRDNYPAAVASAAENLSKALVEFFKTKPKPTKEEKEEKK